MRIQISREQGSTLVMVLLVGSLTLLATVSFLKFSDYQYTSVIRSQTWNSVMPLCEAGVEEALSHLNGSAIGTNWATDGWTFNSPYYTLTRSLAGGTYAVKITTDAYPTIYSTGTLPMGADTITRTIRVTTSRWSTGMQGLLAKGNVVMNGITQIDSFDSTDARYSTRGRYDPAKHKDGGFTGSVNGNVYAQTVYGSVGTGPLGTAAGNVGDFAWLGSQSGIEPGHYLNDLNMSFPEVQAPFDGGAGYPGGPTTLVLTNFDYWSTMQTTDFYPTNSASRVTTNSFGMMTATTYPSSVASSLITTNTTALRSRTMPAPGTYLNLTRQGVWYHYDLITSYTYPSRTYTYSLTASNTSLTTNLYTYVLSSNHYQMPSLSLSGDQRLLVNGEAVLYVTGNFSMSGNSQLIITPGASLKLYVAGDVNLSGNGLFNYTLDGSKFMLYGLPSCRNIALSGNAAFTGCIYAPRADLALNGGGTTEYDIVGAVIVNTVQMNGHFNFHYDEALGRSRILAKFSVAHWSEINPRDLHAGL